MAREGLTGGPKIGTVDDMTDGQRLRAWRQIRFKGSLRGFASQLGWPHQKLHRIETGKQPLNERDREAALVALQLSTVEFYRDLGVQA